MHSPGAASSSGVCSGLTGYTSSRAQPQVEASRDDFLGVVRKRVPRYAWMQGTSVCFGSSHCGCIIPETSSFDRVYLDSKGFRWTPVSGWQEIELARPEPR